MARSLTANGRAIWNLDALLNDTFGDRTDCYDAKTASIFSVAHDAECPSPLARYQTYVFTFLNAFGRGNRDDDLRGNDSSIVQALLLMNDRTVTDRIHAATNGSTVQKLTRSTTDAAVIAEGLYVATLSRYPSPAEKAAAVAYLKSGDLAKKSEDLQFALLNKIEFLFN